jgi:hypothetical protein
MKRIAIITFHASHNYGSVLQAYALQQTIFKLLNKECVCEIINFRSNKQNELYSLFKRNNNLKYIMKNAITIFYYKSLHSKFKKFEEFINNDLILSNEKYTAEEQLLKSNLNYDYYISGSDQIWNLQPIDFNWSYYLDFVSVGKKISYAASFGPRKQKMNNYESEKVTRLLKKYNCISVREEESYNTARKLSDKKIEIHVDSTMLLSKEEWNSLIKNVDIELPNCEYIYFYTLNPSKETIIIVNKISKILNLPVVITKFNNKYDLINNYKKIYSAGPKDFIKLIKNAKIVLSSSFHGTVFSILFNKPFFAINGVKDFRIKTLLSKMSLEDRSIQINDIDEKFEDAYDVDFCSANKMIDHEKMRSYSYLKNGLEIGENKNDLSKE